MEGFLWQIARMAAVLALVLAAALVATPPGRIPLALRGLVRIMSRDRGETGNLPGASASPARRFLAFILVLLAVVLALV